MVSPDDGGIGRLATLRSDTQLAEETNKRNNAAVELVRANSGDT